MSKKLTKTQAKRAIYALLASECRFGDMFAQSVNGEDSIALSIALEEISYELIKKSKFQDFPLTPEEAFQVVENTSKIED